MSFLDKLKYSLAKTRAVIVSQFVSPQWNAEEMERALLAADFGPKLAGEVIVGVRKRLDLNPLATMDHAITAAKDEIESLLESPPSIIRNPQSPQVILLVGVNGAGKTTTAAKLAKHFQTRGDRVLLAAADTFRAAAIEQLKL